MMAEKVPEPVDSGSFLNGEQSETFRNLCNHYTRACSFVAPCCDKVYPCRLCHDEKESHEIDRFALKEIICRKCDHRQPVAKTCDKCLINFARYFCPICHLYDDAEKGQYHCQKCGICRIGGRDNFFHCDTCGLCLQLAIRDTHKCVVEASRSNCPVCMEDLHSSRNAAHVPKCGHLLHQTCFREMIENGLYQCPQCQTSLVDMTSHWQSLDSERQQWLLPYQLRDFYVKIQCRDCRKESETTFHFIGLKCPDCNSYNTVRTGNETLPLEDVNPLLLQNTTFPSESDEDELEHQQEVNDFLNLCPLPLNQIPSTDSDDEYESMSSPCITDEEELDLLMYPPPLLGGNPPPPWLSGGVDLNEHIQHMIHTIPLHFNLHGDDNNEEDEGGVHIQIEDFLPPFPSLGNPLLGHLYQGANNEQDEQNGPPNSDLPQIWEVTENGDDEEPGGAAESDEWETSSEEEVIGGNEEDLGRVECSLSNEKESNPLGDVAPAH